jgi:hypothetical protein
MRVAQASFHVVTHHVHAVVFAWLLKTKVLDNICIKQGDVNEVTNTVYPDRGRWLSSPWERWSLSVKLNCERSVEWTGLFVAT